MLAVRAMMGAAGVAVSDWPDADGYIYNEGTHEDMWVEGYTDGTGYTLTKNSDHLYLFAENIGGPEGRVGSSATWVTDETISIPASATLTLQSDLAGSHPGATAFVVISDNKMSSNTVYDERFNIDYTTDPQEFSLTVTGDYYIRVHVQASSSYNYYYKSLEVFSLKIT